MRCSNCRAILLRAEFQYDKQEIAAFRRLREEWPKEDTDWQLHDPDHPERLVWASDLAKRYRYETKPRPIRNNLRKWY
jgi:hypothetical protein